MTSRAAVDPMTRLLMRTEIVDTGHTSPCWVTDMLLANGYPQVCMKVPFEGRKGTVGARRWAYERIVGPVPKGVPLKDTCSVRACWNPDHLVPTGWADVRVAQHAEPMQRLLEHTEIVDLGASTPCWVSDFTGPAGYSRIAIRVDGKKRQELAHVWAFKFYGGVVPDGYELDHACHSEALHRGLCSPAVCAHRACWCPDHMEPVTHRENILRGYRGIERMAP